MNRKERKKESKVWIFVKDREANNEGQNEYRDMRYGFNEKEEKDGEEGFDRKG